MSTSENGSQSQSGLDSITLGQLRAMVGPVPKPKQSYYDFRYDDEDTVLNEIEEFYSYVEMPQVAENLKAWQGSFNGEWIKSSVHERRAHIELLLESLEHRATEVRFTNARRLFYILQGTFAETTSPEHQLHWIFENAKMVRAANGVSSIVEAIKIATSKHDLLCGLTDAEAAHFAISPQDKADFIEEVTTELSVYFGMLYHLIEVFKSHDDFADEIMSLDPPLPVYIFGLVSSLKDKSARGYPIKKLLLILWKTLLTCWGGIRELARAKKLARELSDLGPIPDEVFPIKSSPSDIEMFRQETSIKYPTYTPPHHALEGPFRANSALLTNKLAQAYSPIPVRHHYHQEESDSSYPQAGPHSFQQQAQSSFQRQAPQPATPAPSPPPSPKPKKQQYQTDQNRPFLFPFSRRGRQEGHLVPFAVEEADKLYNRHMYVSLALAQMWRTREDCMIAESGLEKMPGAEAYDLDLLKTTKSVKEEAAEPLADVALLEQKIAEATEMYEKAQTPTEKRAYKERKVDLLRLKRVEQIYSESLPVFHGWILVLLKLLLATVSAGNSMQAQPSASSVNGFTAAGINSPPEQPPAPPPTLDEIDVTRHREITSKAVSAIILLVLKWFKVSHVMKFHHFGQHLLDTNCLLLILKMFGLQEVATFVVSKADSPENNFFQYCLQNFSNNPQQSRPEDNMLKPSRQVITRSTTYPNGQTHEEEVELLTDFSWRNFFSTINFAKIMQKLSKNRSHRIWMLVQYKSSAVLKRVLRVSHPMLQLHILKLIKSQVPFCGRRWRQSNMKVITSIYLNCRPDLRDEWLTGNEVDDVSDAQAQEHALRHLVHFYTTRRYGTVPAPQDGDSQHRRSGSISNQPEGLHPGPELANILRPVGAPSVDPDVFPPSRPQAESAFLPYITEDIAFEDEYEEYLSDLGLATDDPGTEGGQSIGGTSAWHRLPDYANEMADGISDSESIVSIGDLGDVDRLDHGEIDKDVVDENLNNWEHMSPKTMAALPKSPAGRRSSSGGGLRPVLPFGLDDDSAVDEDLQDDDELGGAPREQTGPFAAGASVDEVEYAYGV